MDTPPLPYSNDFAISSGGTNQMIVVRAKLVSHNFTEIAKSSPEVKIY